MFKNQSLLDTLLFIALLPLLMVITLIAVIAFTLGAFLGATLYVFEMLKYKRKG